MSLGTEPMWQALVERGVLSSERAAELRAALQPAPADGGALLNRLVEQGDVTRYQADLLATKSDGLLEVGPYIVLEPIVEGRLVGLFRARHRSLHVPVCLKVLRMAGSPAIREEQLARFQREARVSVQLDHPHVVRTWHVGQDRDLYFLALEDLRGCSLAEGLEAPDVLAPEAGAEVEWLWDEEREHTWPGAVCRLVREAALGLAHLHEQGIVHRDVCPQNLWITAEGHVKVMDFGLSRDALAYIDSPLMEEQSAGPSGFLGTTDYLSLEQALDSESATPASDIYSLGCTLYHALTGRVPFVAATPAKQMLLHATQTPTPPSQLNPDVPDTLDEVVAGMMAKDPADRYATCTAVADALEPFAEEAEHPPHEVVKTPALLEFMRWLDEEAYVYSRPQGEKPQAEEKRPAARPVAGWAEPSQPAEGGAVTSETGMGPAEASVSARWQVAPIRARKVLFATDFSQLSDAALGQAAALARDSGAKLLIVHVEEPPSAYGGGELYYGVPEPDHHAVQQMLAKIRPEDPAIPVEHHLLMGDPASEIAELAEKEGVDLIVIGTHGRTGLARLLIGSTAEAVVRKAPCAVLTVKMPHK
jgi:nucleotide-binding universal stress UspA family protein